MAGKGQRRVTERTKGRLVSGQMTRRVKIASLATYVPPRVLTNADLEKRINTSDEWITKRTGVRERHVVDEGVASSDLGKEAAVYAIKQAGLTADDIGFIVVRIFLQNVSLDRAK